MNDIEALEVARLHLQFSFHDLWVRCVGIGGHLDAVTLRGYLAGDLRLSDFDHDQIVLALNEALDGSAGHEVLAFRNG